jgi:hypothetical protein
LILAFIERFDEDLSIALVGEFTNSSFWLMYVQCGLQMYAVKNVKETPVGRSALLVRQRHCLQG